MLVAAVILRISRKKRRGDDRYTSNDPFSECSIIYFKIINKSIEKHFTASNN